MADELNEFEGLPVTEVGVEMPGASGGLRDAVKFDPVEWHQGDEHFIVLKGTVSKIRHEPVDKDKPDGEQRRVHVLQVEEAFPIAAEDVADYVAAQSARIKKLKDEAEGTPSLDLEGTGQSDDLPIGADDDFEDDEDEKSRREEYEARKAEGEDPEEARRAVWGDKAKDPVAV